MADEDFMIFLEDFTAYVDETEEAFAKALEAVRKLKGQIAKLVGVAEKPKWSWNPDKIGWAEAEGSKGKFQRSEDFNNPEFKALLKDLAQHNGKLTRNGWFYWTFKNGSTVGRKKR